MKMVLLDFTLAVSPPDMQQGQTRHAAPLTFIGVVHEELVEELVLQRHSLHRRVGDDVVVGHVVEPWYRVEGPAGLLVAEERHGFCLGALVSKVLH